MLRGSKVLVYITLFCNGAGTTEISTYWHPLPRPADVPLFRGREQHRPELGGRLLQLLAGDVEELGFVESSPKQDGHNMIMVLGPHRKKADAKVEMQAEKDSKVAERDRKSTRLNSSH